ncbi:MAG: hypothetical protein WBQ94_04185 [Terracidiphilus sp.]
MKINKLEMEWTDEGCFAIAEGFEGVMLTCPRCQALLPRNAPHICGEIPKQPAPKLVTTKAKKLKKS